MNQPPGPSDKVEEPQDALAADAASLQTPAAFAQFLSSRLSTKDKARYVSEFAGPQDRMKAMSPAAHEEHLLRVKEMVAESERMGHGILGAEVFSVINNRSEEQPSSKRRKLSRAEVDAARELQDDKEEREADYSSRQIRSVSQSVENPAIDAAVHAEAESPGQGDAETTDVRPKGNTEVCSAFIILASLLLTVASDGELRCEKHNAIIVPEERRL